MAHAARVALPVRLWGMDVHGKPFNLVAHTTDVWPTGAKIEGLLAQMQPGDVVGAQYRQAKTRFTVEHATSAGAAWNLRLETTFPLEDFWGIDFASLVEAPSDRRRHPRYTVAADAEVMFPGSVTSVNMRASDLSISGCYLGTFSPPEPGTELNIRLNIMGVQLEATGTVRVSHLGLGMGVEFTAFATLGDRELLVEVIRRLEAGEEGTGTSFFAPRERTQAITDRLGTVTRDLAEAEDLLKQTHVDPGVLRQFREALSMARNTAWGVQKMLEMQAAEPDAAAMVNYVNRERLRSAVDLCRTIAADISQLGITVRRSDAQDLMSAVEELFHELSKSHATGEKEPVETRR